MALSEDAAVRYGRQVLLAEVGAAGQERLLAARVLVRGKGRAAEEARTYLRAAGVRVEVDPAPDAAVLEVPGDSRLAGAWEALRAAVALSGAAETSTWPSAEEVEWHRS